MIIPNIISQFHTRVILNYINNVYEKKNLIPLTIG
jgi:hypothetical protein